MNNKTILLAVTVLVTLLLTAYFSLYVVRTNETVIVTHFGDPVRVVREPGLKWKRPGFLSTVHRFKTWKRTFKTKPIQLLLGDQNPVILTLYVTWKINDSVRFFTSFNRPRNESATRKLSDMVHSYLGSTLGSYSLEDLINVREDEVKLDRIEDAILRRVRYLAGEEYGINVNDLGIRRINYPKAVTQSVYQRMRAEREREAKKFRAQGRMKATEIRNQANKKKQKILSEARRRAEIIRGRADSRAIRIYGRAYSRDTDFFRFQKSLAAYRDVLTSKSTLVLSTESDFFRYLNDYHHDSGTP